MRRAVLALTTILVIVFLMQPIAQVTMVEAHDTIFRIDNPKIIVNSPLSAPYVYTKPSFDISFEYQVPTKLPQVESFSYKLDGKPLSSLTISKKTSDFRNYFEYTVFKTVENLTNGNHNLKAYACFLNGTTSPILDTTVIVNTSFIPPIPFMISPLNQTTYTKNQVQLTYSINSKVIWSYYSLDDYHSSFDGNITLPAISAGSHRLRLFVTTESYELTTFKDSIQTIYFSIDSNQIIQVTPVPSQSTPSTPNPTQTSNPTPYLPPNDRNAPHLEPTFYLLPISVIAAIIVIAIIIYRKGRKHLTSKQSFL